MMKHTKRERLSAIVNPKIAVTIDESLLLISHFRSLSPDPLSILLLLLLLLLPLLPDQIRNNYGFPSSSDQTILKGKALSLFPEHRFSFCKRKWRNSFDRIRCAYLNQSLKPRPRPIPNPTIIDDNVNETIELDDFRVKKPSVSLCCQIEKLVVCGRYRQALDLFEIFEIEGGFDVDAVTYDALISACIGLRSVRGVKRIYHYMKSNGFEPDLYMRNRVLLMHVKGGQMKAARCLFDEMPEKNLVSWTTIIGGLLGMGQYFEAFKLFLIMWEELSECDPRLFSTIIRACAGLGSVSVGKQLHACTLKMGMSANIFVSCSLIDMYSKCGSIEDAHFVFEDMPEKTTVGWNTIITGYALHGYSKEALDLFFKMRASGVKMDHFTISLVVRVSTRLASLDYAKQAHAALLRRGYRSDMVANTCFVDFYSKWGRVEYALHVFEQMPCKNVLSWNALIAGYGNRGEGTEALKLFHRMLEENVRPSHITFLGVLSACCYSDLPDEGWSIFKDMEHDHGIAPRAMHYAIMIELLGREGLVDEAFALLRAAPFKPTENMWAALLTACRVEKNLELGRYAAEKLYGMEPEKLHNYLVVLNIHNSSGNSKEAAGVLHTLRRKGMNILPACSWIEVRRVTHLFHFGEKSHPQSKEVHEKVGELRKQISNYGYVAGEKTVLPDVDDKDQRKSSLQHSEMLAVAFGVMNTPGWVPLQVVQAHRVCSDCHEAIKLIAMMNKREIIVRDGSRFHHFKDGHCSCGDYW
ncbi:Pentatricopeptide repeat-containing protein At5g50390, chloroplastic [Linum perenne]